GPQSSLEGGRRLTLALQPRRCGGAAIGLVLLVLGTACADDTTVTTGPGMDTESSTGGTDTVPSTATLVTSLDTTDSAGTAEGTSSDGDATDSLDSSGTSTSTTGETETETDGTTGDEVIPGQTVGQLVTAGTRSTSTSYTLVY